MLVVASGIGWPRLPARWPTESLKAVRHVVHETIRSCVTQDAATRLQDAERLPQRRGELGGREMFDYIEHRREICTGALYGHCPRVGQVDLGPVGDLMCGDRRSRHLDGR